MSEYDEDSLIDEIRRKDERIRELEEELEQLRGHDKNHAQDVLVDPEGRLKDYRVRVEPRDGDKGVFIELVNNSAAVRLSTGCDIDTGENIAHTILNICRQQREAEAAKRLAELAAKPIDDDF